MLQAIKKPGIQQTDNQMSKFLQARCLASIQFNCWLIAFSCRLHSTFSLALGVADKEAGGRTPRDGPG